VPVAGLPFRLAVLAEGRRDLHVTSRIEVPPDRVSAMLRERRPLRATTSAPLPSPTSNGGTEERRAVTIADSAQERTTTAFPERSDEVLALGTGSIRGSSTTSLGSPLNDPAADAPSGATTSGLRIPTEFSAPGVERCWRARRPDRSRGARR
jgi:hypothetical protein